MLFRVYGGFKAKLTLLGFRGVALLCVGLRSLMVRALGS